LLKNSQAATSKLLDDFNRILQKFETEFPNEKEAIQILRDKTQIAKEALNKIRSNDDTLLEDEKNTANKGNKHYKTQITFFHQELNKFNYGLTDASKNLSEEDSSKLKVISSQTHDDLNKSLDDVRKEQEVIRRAGFGK